MKRSKHSLSNYTLATFDMGELVPIGMYEVLPGDSIRQSTSALVRVSPLMSPVMHPVQVRIHHWFVPYRLVWDGWEDFITGVSEAPFPVVASPAIENSIADYMGVPPGASSSISALPIRAYNKIYNEFYRDQDLDLEVDEESVSVRRVAWEKDYFTSARPWTQKGPEVTLPIGQTAPIIRDESQPYPYLTVDGDTAARRLSGVAASQAVSYETPVVSTSGGGRAKWSPSTTGISPGLIADLSAVSGIPIGDVRLAFAIQRYQEARAQYGSRYSEYLRYLGVRSSDARLQRPEYLGGGKSTISFSEVLKTGEGDTPSDESPVGEMRGHGIAGLRSRRFVRFFEEHGVVLTLASVRPRTMYASGLDRKWSRRTKEDFWQKELELIGQQEVYNREVYHMSATADDVFGYQDRYAEYRHEKSHVTGEFRNLLSDWHLARIFAAQPALNSAFISCEPSKRIHAEQTQHALWCMFSHSIQARRLVTKKTIGRVV